MNAVSSIIPQNRMSTPDWSLLRSEFPVTDHWAYFNHAAMTPYSNRVRGAIARFLDECQTQGVMKYWDWQGRIADLRSSLGTLLNAPSADIGLVSTTTDGLLILAHGLDWQPGDVIITGEREFPANIHPWLNLRDRGVEVRFVPEREGRMLPEDIEQAIDARTRLVSLSWVSFISGYRQDLAAVSQICRDRGVIFAVDAIQGLGALSFDLTQTPVDFLACGGQKWMMGPEGTAFVYCQPDLRRRLGRSLAGWRSVKTPDDYLGYEQPLIDDARAFEKASTNTIGFLGLQAAVDLMLEVGPQAIEARIMSLHDHLIAGLGELGYPIYSDTDPKYRSGILSFYPRAGEDAQAIADRCTQAGISIAARLGYVRIAPHFYNSFEEIDRLLNILR